MNTSLIKAIIILPGTSLAYVPALIIWITRNTVYSASFHPTSAIIWLAGLVFTVAGLGLMLSTMRLYATKGGGGTPAPWDPIKNFIVLGPYSYVRNPMLIGVNMFLTAEAIILQSIPIFLWMIVFVIVNTIYFAFSEEPQLEKRFGQTYSNYKNNVPRWIPRLTPYRGMDWKL